MKNWQFVVLGLTSAAFIAGCTPNINADYYNTSNTQQVNVVQHGVIVSVSQVSVSGSGSDVGDLVGPLAGGAAGAVAGASMGGGNGSTLLGIGGALLGGIAGQKAEQALTSQTASQYIVQLTDGSTVSVTQGGAALAVGTHVLLLEGNPARLIIDTTVAASGVKTSNS